MSEKIKPKYIRKEDISLEDVLNANRDKGKALINEIEREEATQKKETVDDVEREIKLQHEITNKKKSDFIRDMKNDLGKQMMKNPSKVNIRTKSFGEKLSDFFKKVFTKF